MTLRAAHYDMRLSCNLTSTSLISESHDCASPYILSFRGPLQEIKVKVQTVHIYVRNNSVVISDTGT